MSRVKKILCNRAKCLLCGEVLESKNTQDYKTCSCGNLSVDGGTEYLRRLIKQGIDSIQDMSIYESDCDR